MKKVFILFLTFFFISSSCLALEEYSILAPSRGVITDLPTIALPDEYLVDAENCWTKDGTIQRSTMRLKEFSDVLSDDVIGIDYFQMKNLTNFLIIMTKKDICYRSPSTADDRYVYLTPQYTTGTASFVNGDATVEGGGCLWQTNLAPGDFIKTGSAVASSDDTWYQILSITDEDTLELTANYAAANSGAAVYRARTVFTGADTDLWDFATAYKEDIWVATNNAIDQPVSWNGSDATVTNIATIAKAKYVIYYQGYLIWGSLANYPQRMQWAELGDFDDYTNGDTGTSDVEGSDAITGFSTWQDFLVIFKERSIHLAWVVTTDLVFNKDVRVRGIGGYANKSNVSLHNRVYFWASDGKFRAFNGLHANEEISEGISEYVDAIPPNYEKNIYGMYIEELKQIWWAIPKGPASTYNDKVLVYDLETQSWWNLDLEIACFGNYISEASYTWDTIPYATWDEWGGRWDDRTFTASAPLDLAGNRDGYVYRVHAAEQDNASAFTGYFELNQNAFKQPNQRKRLLRYKVYFEREIGGTISLQMRVDDKIVKETAVTKNLDDQDDRNIQEIEIITDVSGKYFGLYAEATNAFEFIGIRYEYEIIGDR